MSGEGEGEGASRGENGRTGGAPGKHEGSQEGSLSVREGEGQGSEFGAQSQDASHSHSQDNSYSNLRSNSNTGSGRGVKPANPNLKIIPPSRQNNTVLNSNSNSNSGGIFTPSPASSGPGSSKHRGSGGTPTDSATQGGVHRDSPGAAPRDAATLASYGSTGALSNSSESGLPPQPRPPSEPSGNSNINSNSNSNGVGPGSRPSSRGVAASPPAEGKGASGRRRGEPEGVGSPSLSASSTGRARGATPVSHQGSEGSFTDSPRADGKGLEGKGGGSFRQRLASQGSLGGYGSPGTPGSGVSSPSVASGAKQLPSVPAGVGPPVMQAFTYRELREATGGFAKGNLLGEGGFGCVYKGKMRARRLSGAGDAETDPRVGKSPGPIVDVAVKLLNEGSLQGQKEWLVSGLYMQ